MATIQDLQNHQKIQNRTVRLPKTFAEYFAGIGLVRMGLQQNGWNVVFANDFSEKKHELYKAFFQDADQCYVIEDIFQLDPASIPVSTLATCSFPCIDLSLAGNMTGIVRGNHSSAFWGFVNILRSQADNAPQIVLIENVPGWLSSNDGKDFRITVQALNALGYACNVFILDALRFTPQSRLRVFLIGSKLPTKNVGTELMLSRPKSLLSNRLRKCIIDNRDLNWFSLDLPEPPFLNEGGLSQIVERLNANDTRWWSDEEVTRHLKMMKPEHRTRVEQLQNGRELSFRTFFRRRRDGFQRAEVRYDDLAGCLRTAVGGSAKQFLIQAGRGTIRMRAMTPREYARLQGVPDECEIPVGDIQALTGFGDAVCVPAISWIAKNVIERLIQNI